MGLADSVKEKGEKGARLVRRVYYTSGLREAHIRYHGLRLRAVNGRVRNGAGIALYVDPDDRRGRLMSRYHGKFDTDAVGLWNHLYTRLDSSVLLDVGANYGEVSLSRRYPAGTIIHLIEVNEAVLRRLRRSASRLDADVRIHEWAASDRGGEATFHIAPRHSGLGSLDLDIEGATVNVTLRRIDEAIEVPTGARLLFKIDVEGHELPVLRGMQNLLARCDEWAGFCEASHLSEADAAELLDRFAVHSVEPETWRLVRAHQPSEILSPGDGFTKDVVLAPPSGLPAGLQT
jgi:FkbM family methyltransferase